MIRLVLFAAVIGAGGHAAAENEDIKSQAQKLGLTIGQSYICLDGEARETLKLDAQIIFDMIIKDAGSDIAFSYATSTGFGAAKPKEEVDCAKLAETLVKIRENFDLGEE
ncbi:MAG: hypothetical protein AAF526_08845 [Pseudomonadota bacterium]